MKIETISGALVDPVNPQKCDIQLQDIAWSLSRISRFAGHTVTTQPYTVGQHCAFVAEMLYNKTNDPVLALYGLLHDSAECFIGDLPSPVKRIPEIKEHIAKIEDNILHVIFDAFGLPQPSIKDWLLVKQYDKRAQFIEAYNYMPSRGKDWQGREEFDIGFVELQQFPEPKPSIVVYENFLQLYDAYMRELKLQQ